MQTSVGMFVLAQALQADYPDAWLIKGRWSAKVGEWKASANKYKHLPAVPKSKVFADSGRYIAQKEIMKPLEILADYFASQKLSEVHNQIDALIRIALLNYRQEHEKFVEFGQGLHELVDVSFLLAGK